MQIDERAHEGTETNSFGWIEQNLLLELFLTLFLQKNIENNMCSNVTTINMQGDHNSLEDCQRDSGSVLI